MDLSKQQSHCIPSDLAHQIAQAVCLYKAGRYQSALELVDKSLLHRPAEAVLLNNRGLILEALNRPAEAIHAYQKAILLAPEFPDSYINIAALTHSMPGKFEHAVSLCRKAIDLVPASVKALITLGCIYQSRSMWEQAAACHEKAVAIAPDTSEAHQNLGLIMAAMSRHSEAIEFFQKALLLRPDCARTWNDLGISLRAAGRLQDALHAYDKAIEKSPDAADIWYHKGNLLQDLKQYQPAADAYIHAIRLQNNNAYYWNNLGVVLRAMNQNKRAFQAYRKAIEYAPAIPETYNNLGLVLETLHQPEQAVLNYQKAIRLKPDFAEAWRNMADSYKELCQTTAAIEHYRKAITLRPDLTSAWWNLSLTLLQDGQLKEGFSLYLYRKQPELEIFTYPHNLPALRWDGTAYTGKTLLIYCEQGLGDSIQFARYLPLVKKLGGTLILEAPAPLTRLFQQSRLADQVLTAEACPPTVHYDLCASIMDLPALFKTELETIPDQCPYLAAKKTALPEQPNHSQNLNVGIVWAGNPNHGNDKNRSCTLDLFETLAMPGVCFYSLQKGGSAGQFAPLSGSEITDLQPLMTDFASTAALMQSMDLIISVDTSTAHLAGALGRPVWTLLPFSPDWRWLLNRNDSPWYPTMRLFRQKTRGDWHGVFAEIRRELELLTFQKGASR